MIVRFIQHVFDAVTKSWNYVREVAERLHITPRMGERRFVSRCRKLSFLAVGLILVLTLTLSSRAEPSGIVDGSFEETQQPDKFGRVFKHWEGWKYEGECEFRVSTVAHSGNTSCLLYGSNQPKIRMFLNQRSVQPGRYKITAYLRGLEIGVGVFKHTTEFAFNDNYIQLEKNGTFGWTKLTYVTDVKRKSDILGPSFGLMAPGYLWIDDVSMVRVGDDVPLTPKPILGKEEQPILPPHELSKNVVHCPQCSYRNSQDWKSCYACGEKLKLQDNRDDGELIKRITSFERKSFFENGKIVKEHATDGSKAWRIDRGYSDWWGDQDWAGYDYFKVDVYTDSKKPLGVYVEIRDKLTQGYWTRVNYMTVIPSGSSTLIIPIDQLYVGEKSRPGRMLMLSDITRLVFQHRRGAARILVYR